MTFNSNTQPRVRKQERPDKVWQCTSCGADNRPYLKQCGDCGKRK